MSGVRRLAGDATLVKWQPYEESGLHAYADETVGYVISGQAKLHSEGQMVRLASVDSWVVSKSATHKSKIPEPLTAVEATHPSFHGHARDEA